MNMELEESILQTAVLEGPVPCNGLLKDRHAIVTLPDGTKRRTYARIFIHPTVLEIARRYAEGYPKPSDDLDIDAIVASAFLEGGMFCARDGSRREEFLKLDEKCKG